MIVLTFWEMSSVEENSLAKVMIIPASKQGPMWWGKIEDRKVLALAHCSRDLARSMFQSNSSFCLVILPSQVSTLRVKLLLLS